MLNLKGWNRQPLSAILDTISELPTTFLIFNAPLTSAFNNLPLEGKL